MLWYRETVGCLTPGSPNLYLCLTGTLLPTYPQVPPCRPKEAIMLPPPSNLIPSPKEGAEELSQNPPPPGDWAPSWVQLQQSDPQRQPGLWHRQLPLRPLADLMRNCREHVCSGLGTGRGLLNPLWPKTLSKAPGSTRHRMAK